MLANDSVTVAIEIPIWLDENDIAALEAEHGIELAPRVGAAARRSPATSTSCRCSNGCVHVLDYKPDARTNKPIAQLAIYALALTRLVPGLKLFDIKCAWFNEHEYCEIFPRTLFKRPASVDGASHRGLSHRKDLVFIDPKSRPSGRAPRH